MAGLRLEHIYKVYPNGTKAVSDFTMDIKDQEFIVFVGPSGCGKSTTLRMIAGLDNRSLYQNIWYMIGGLPSDEITDEYVEQYGTTDVPRLDEILGTLSSKLEKWNQKVNGEIRKNFENAIAEKSFKYNEQSDEENFLEEKTDYFIEKRNAFVEGKYPSEWFSTEEIKEFIKNNFKSAETPEEKEIDRILSEINKLDRWSLDYYETCFAFDGDCYNYFCDNRWREAGIEELIKSYYNLPDINDCIDEQDGDE